MSVKEDIKDAIGTHVMWKAKLIDAIKRGASDLKVEVVSADNQCAFGKWLYGTSLTGAQKTAGYLACRQMHAEFHRVAGEVLRQALAGHREAAEKEIGAGGKFSSASAKLTSAMLQWHDEV
jgi:hypothetical protein